jgi:hypothetical protein
MCPQNSSPDSHRAELERCRIDLEILPLNAAPGFLTDPIWGHDSRLIVGAFWFPDSVGAAYCSRSPRNERRFSLVMLEAVQ